MALEHDKNLLDVSGLRCPIPVLRARRVLDTLHTGDRLTVTATDPASIHDMPAFCNMSGHKLINARQDGDLIVFEIEKGAA